ncbi:unnamed protein product [Menidia menidia]|uniref:(Atlantic silverside) hypothetical protein n=1 Tax=Menidia menidia TaxID=238744 RepID=A0A8S4BZU8_9TELE|nr:unnamed protein product [Menidia menidia]
MRRSHVRNMEAAPSAEADDTQLNGVSELMELLHIEVEADVPGRPGRDDAPCSRNVLRKQRNWERQLAAKKSKRREEKQRRKLSREQQSGACLEAPQISKRLLKAIAKERLAEARCTGLRLCVDLSMTDCMSDKEEILYQYPVCEASRHLKGVRGIFLTLSDMLEGVTGGRILSSSLLLGKHLDGNKLLVIGLPAERVPLLALQTLLGDVVRTLKVMYGSLDRAFCRPDQAPRLDHFFCLFFQQLIQPFRLRGGASNSPPDVSGTLFLDGLPAVRWLTLPPEIKRHFMQCVLLEAGGCASPALGSTGPDCVYVDQVKATLLQLEALEGGIRARLAAPPTPCLSCADWFLPAARERPTSPILSRLAGVIRGSSPSGGGPGPLPPPPRPGREAGGPPGLRGLRRPLQDVQDETPQPFLPGHPEEEPDGEGGRGGVQQHKGFGGWRPVWLTPEFAFRLTAGAENPLFHYVLMENVQGIFIAPTHGEVAQLSGSVHPRLIRNFHHCCLSIRHAFQQSLPARGRRGADRSPGGWGLGPVKEHGVLFQCKPENWTDQKRPPPTMTYWVIGRMLLEPVPQEFYVCFHDSVAEVPVEMAFRLSFGLAP